MVNGNEKKNDKNKSQQKSPVFERHDDCDHGDRGHGQSKRSKCDETNQGTDMDNDGQSVITIYKQAVRRANPDEVAEITNFNQLRMSSSSEEGITSDGTMDDSGEQNEIELTVNPTLIAGNSRDHHGEERRQTPGCHDYRDDDGKDNRGTQLQKQPHSSKQHVEE